MFKLLLPPSETQKSSVSRDVLIERMNLLPIDDVAVEATAYLSLTKTNIY